LIASPAVREAGRPRGRPFTFLSNRRQFLTTDEVPLPGIFETPVISTTPGPNSCAVAARVGSNTAKARGTRVYMNSRAFIAPASMVPDHSVWHIIVIDLGGAPRWSREFRPGGGPGANPDDVGWTINPGLSGVGDVLGFGDEDDVIRIYRQRFNPNSVDNRDTFLDVLTGEVIRDIQHTVERSVFTP
jgi:hypothetical protein